MVQPNDLASVEMLTAYIKAKGSFKKFKKSGTGPYGSHVSLQDIEDATGEALRENDLEIIFNEFFDPNVGRRALRTWLFHAPTQKYVEDMRLYLDDDVSDQVRGSSQTYLRRQALYALLGVPNTCDDGEAQKKHHDKKKAYKGKGKGAQDDTPATKQQADLVTVLLKRTDSPKEMWEKVCSFNGVKSFSTMTAAQARNIINYLEGQVNK